MGFIIKTLIEVKTLFSGQYSNIKDAYQKLGREAFLQTVYDTAVEEQENYCQGIVRYFHHGFSFEDDNKVCVIGVSDPEELTGIAENWNTTIIDQAVSAFRELETAKEIAHVSSLSDFLEKLEKKEIILPDFDYDMVLYRLRHALSDLDNIFLFGGRHLIMTEAASGYGYQYRIKMNDEALAKIKNHPENYVILYTSYH